MPWLLLAFGLVGLGAGVLVREHKIDFKAGARANAFVLFFGPVGARVAWVVVGGGFVGFAIGLWAQ